MSTLAISDTTTPRRGLRIALWSVQGLLAFAFGAAGLMKLTQPLEALAATMAWTISAPEWLVRFVGAAEFAGALGLVLPALTRIQPRLTGLAATGLVVVMALALGLHVTRGEFEMLGAPFVLGALAAFVAWGRTKVAPIAPRQR